jgi:hypothetical protein
LQNRPCDLVKQQAFRKEHILPVVDNILAVDTVAQDNILAVDIVAQVGMLAVDIVVEVGSRATVDIV